MTSRYRVDYSLKEHRRDGLIEWIKGLLATPFVLYAVKTNGAISAVEELIINSEATRRYAEIFHDLEKLINDHIEMAKCGTPELSRLRQLVPSVGAFFTKLPLEQAFYIQDERRSISKRRLVAPSFNDIRLILNTSQILQLSMPFHDKMKKREQLQLITFDGDITLYNDGENFSADSPLLTQLILLLSKDLVIGIVTAAGYKDASKYYFRLSGLIDGIKHSDKLTDEQRGNLLIMGGEANYLFRYSNELGGLKYYDSNTWVIEDMTNWTIDNINRTLDFAQENLENLVHRLSLPAIIIRKEKAVGLVPKEGFKLIREQLEEVVLRVDSNLRQFPAAKQIRFCAFNGGSDIWVDIGDKSLGVKVLQQFLKQNDGKIIGPHSTLHIGDQFYSIGSNDYASRTAATTCWISSPEETNGLLVDLIRFIDEWATY